MHYLIASAVAAFLGVSAILMSTLPEGSQADLFLSPSRGVVTVGETFTVMVKVRALTPSNVFSGEIGFNPQVVTVERIDYNTSVANLWAEKPWYSNGDGTINFIGGTTIRGGFTGEDTLLTVTFKTQQPGMVRLGFTDVRILIHDGFGTDAAVAAPIDAIFTVSEAELNAKTVAQKTVSGPTVHIIPEWAVTDLNQDGQQSAVDVSIFMTDLIIQNKRSDFNGDGKVSTADLSIIMNAR